MLTDEEKEFIRRRERLNNLWPYVAVFLIVAIGGLFWWLLQTAPQLVNPYYVVDQVKANKLPQTTLSLMAVLCPLFAILSFMLLIIIIVYGWGWMAMEKKYIKLVTRLEQLGNT